MGTILSRFCGVYVIVLVSWSKYKCIETWRLDDEGCQMPLLEMLYLFISLISSLGQKVLVISSFRKLILERFSPLHTHLWVRHMESDRSFLFSASQLGGILMLLWRFLRSGCEHTCQTGSLFPSVYQDTIRETFSLYQKGEMLLLPLLKVDDLEVHVLWCVLL